MRRYYNKHFNNELNDIIKFKFYVDGIEEFKIKEFEEMETKYYKSVSDNYQTVEFYFFEKYWGDWWKYNSNDFWIYMEKKHSIFKTKESNGFIEFEINKIVKKLKNYEIIYNYDVVGDTKIIINIIIQSMSKEENKSGKEDKYDIDLENIKMDIKNFWLKKLKERENELGQDIVRCKCIWSEDTQSLNLSNKAYREINIIENYLRNFMNEVMLNRIGVNWQEKFKQTNIENKFLSRRANYRNGIKSFSNIDDFLLLIDSDDLYKIMNYRRGKVAISSDGEDLNILINEIKNEEKPELYINKMKKLVDKIDEKYTFKSKSIWDICFSDLFDIKNKDEDINNVDENLKSDFREKWSELCKYRNHIAHNKFIDSNFYNDLNNLVTELKYEIDEAQEEFFVQLEDEKNSSSWYYDLVFISKKDREKIIYEQLVDFTYDIVNKFKTKGLNVSVEKGFRHYGSDSKEFQDEFIIFINNTRNSIKAIKMIEVEMDDKINLQVTRKRGELCSYIVEFLVNEDCIEKTEIAHDGYGFCCEGYSEITGDDDDSEYYRAVIGQSWDYWRSFENHIINYLD